MPALRDTAEDVLTDPVVIEAMERGFIELKGDRVTYNLASKKTYDWSDPEEWVVENKAAGQTAAAATIEARIRRAHSAIWSGGKRDPLTAFDEWSKLLFAKVIDERTTPTGQPRRFQVGSNETVASVANRIHELFALPQTPTQAAPAILQRSGHQRTAPRPCFMKRRTGRRTHLA